MKKLLAESLNEWKLFGKKADTPVDPYENEYKIGKQIENLFHELGFDDAAVGSFGHNRVGIDCEHSNQMFLIKKNGDIYYEGIEFTGEQKPEKIGNINDPDELKKELEKILV